MANTIHLDDETIAMLAAEVVLRLKGVIDPSQSVTPPEPETHRTQTAPVSGDAGWDSPAPAAPEAPAPAQDVAHCPHGPMKWVPPGYSQRTGKSYQGFWGCQAPRGTPCSGRING